MAITYRTPGVYIEEKPGPAKPIQGVGTSTAAFAGRAPKSDQHVGVPVAINNWSQFRREFVDDAGGRPVAASTDLSDAVFGFFQNGGQLVYVLDLGDRSISSLRATDLDVLTSYDVQIVAVPGGYDAAVHDALLSHCEATKTRMAILDGPPGDYDLADLVKVGQVAGPPPVDETAPGEPAGGASDEAGGAGGPPSTRHLDADNGYRPRDSEMGLGAFYVPRVAILDPLGEGSRWAAVSGFVAGAWARNDAERGVHSAPANMVLRGALNLERRITDAEQGALNENGVDCIRFFPGRGNLIWGARTVASDPELRYIPVRRLLTYLEQSIQRSTQWAVFQPNGPTLWKTLTLSVSAFLTRVWRDGALFGTSPDQAFFVQCDEETNPPEGRDAGIVLMRIGVAPMKPAEFVVFEVSQFQAGSDVAPRGVSRG